MLIEAGYVQEGGLLKADICIVGSGPAGLTLARELSSANLRIIIVDSGGKSPANSGPDLNSGSVESPQGYPEHVLVEGRRRQLGGSANLWNHEPRGQKEKFIRCVPLDEEDFEKRDWVPNSGWPFSRAELAPFYQRAQSSFGLGSFSYESAFWQKDAAQFPIVETGKLESSVSQFGVPRHFMDNAFACLAKIENVQIHLEAVLLELTRDLASAKIVSADLLAANGRRFQIRATVFVLAAGGLENPRILLLNQKAQQGGLGNQHDMVGRCFMDHPSITLGSLAPASRQLFDQAGFYDQHLIDGQPVMGKLQIRPEIKQQEKLLNLYAVLVPRFRNLRDNLPFIFKELLAKGPQFFSRHRPSQPVASGRSVEAELSIRQRLLGGYFSECYCGWSHLRNKANRFGDFSIRALVEQTPNRENRVMLGNESDLHGQKKIKVIWKWSDLDLQSIRRTQEIFRDELKLGTGAFTPTAETEGETPRAFYSTHHFMGTTRMHYNPREGVVDLHGKVHGLENLYVAGSSTFPTGGCANPTLTLVALAIRLADHLRREIQPGTSS